MQGIISETYEIHYLSDHLPWLKDSKQNLEKYRILNLQNNCLEVGIMFRLIEIISEGGKREYLQELIKALKNRDNEFEDLQDGCSSLNMTQKHILIKGLEMIYKDPNALVSQVANMAVELGAWLHSSISAVNTKNKHHPCSRASRTQIFDFNYETGEYYFQPSTSGVKGGDSSFTSKFLFQTPIMITRSLQNPGQVCILYELSNDSTMKPNYPEHTGTLMNRDELDKDVEKSMDVLNILGAMQERFVHFVDSLLFEERKNERKDILCETLKLSEQLKPHFNILKESSMRSTASRSQNMSKLSNLDVAIDNTIILKEKIDADPRVLNKLNYELNPNVYDKCQKCLNSYANDTKFIIPLQCGHRFCLQCVINEIYKQKQQIPSYTKVWCLEQSCGYILNDKELVLSLDRTKYRQSFYEGYVPYGRCPSQCQLCGSQEENSLITLDCKTHIICTKCADRYITYSLSTQYKKYISLPLLIQDIGRRDNHKDMEILCLEVGVGCPHPGCPHGVLTPANYKRIYGEVGVHGGDEGGSLEVVEESKWNISSDEVGDDFIRQALNLPEDDDSLLGKSDTEKWELYKESLKPKPPKMRDCVSCGEQHPLSELISNEYGEEGCEHYYCKESLIGWVKSRKEAGADLETVICPDPDCMRKGIKIRADIIRAHVPKEEYEILEKKVIEKKFRLFTCPSCIKKFDITGIRDAVLTCPDCQIKTCRGCLLPAHEGKCSEAERQSVMKALKDAGAIMVCACPNCMQINEKSSEDGCNHVKCQQCQKDFCIAGGCKREPILAHGNHYHRPDCRDFSDYKGEDPPKPDKCIYCKKLADEGENHICRRPGPLVDGDIPENERPEIG